MGSLAVPHAGMDKITIAYLIAIVAGVVLAAWRLQKVRTTYGSAYWLKPWTAEGRGLFKDDGGVLAGDWTGLLPVYYRGDGHVLTCAPTGGGKGTAAILPNLLRYPWLFVLDPGGENTAVAIKAWRNKGYEVFCLNPWGMHEAAPWALPSHSINPLDILDPNSRTFASDADLLAEMIVSRSGNEAGNSSYFKDQAQAALRAVLMHIVTTEPPERRNLFMLRKSTSGSESDWAALLEKMKSNHACGGLIAREAAQLERREGQAPEEFSAIMSTLKDDTDFIEDPVMERALCASDVDMSALKGVRNGKDIPGCVVSVVVPLEYKDTHAVYSRLILAVALWTMQRPPLARGRVLFVLDEFPSLGRVKRVSQGLAELRKYNVRLWPVIQNLGQLIGLYGKEWQTFIGNCGMKQFIGAADLETANYVSALCGGATIEVTQGRGAQARTFETGRALATAEEVMRADSRLQYVFMDELKPMQLLKTPYWMRPEMRGQFLTNPYREETPKPDPNAPLKALWGQLYWLCAWLVRPSPYVVAALVMFLLVHADAAVNIGGTVDRQKRIAICRYAGVSGVWDGEVRLWQRKGCPAVLLWSLAIYERDM